MQYHVIFLIKDAQLALDRKRNFLRTSSTKINREYNSLMDSICIKFKILKEQNKPKRFRSFIVTTDILLQFEKLIESRH